MKQIKRSKWIVTAIFIFFLVVLPLAYAVFCIGSCFGWWLSPHIDWTRPINTANRYGLDERFENADGTCTFTLKEVAVAQNIRYGQEVYDGKRERQVLIVKAEVELNDYALQACSVNFEGPIVDNRSTTYWIHYTQNEEGVWKQRALTDENGEFLLELCETLNPEVSFRGQKQTYSGDLYLCLDLNDEQYRYLLEQNEKSSDNSKRLFDFNVTIEESLRSKEGSAYIGCYFNQMTIMGTYRI